MLRIVCPNCGEEYPASTFEWVCVRCGGHLEAEGSDAFNPARIDHSMQSLWRYRAFLPLPEGAQPVSLGEGWTPLVPAQWGEREVRCKFDFLMPTGSFKDRGSTVIASVLGALGIRYVVEDSSGNAAASLAAYAARAGIRARIFAPAHASPMKLAQIRVYGAELTPVEGPREESARAAQNAVIDEGAYYASHYFNPFALAGMETTAWELWEQLGRSPDHIVLPVGHGTNFIGMYRGWKKLHARGLINRLPRLHAVQTEKVAPLVLAFRAGAQDTSPVVPSRTIAEGIAITRPARGAEILRAIAESGGSAVAVSEEEISKARSGLARQGIFVEPTSATTFAALPQLRELIGPDEIVVASLTGSGLKSN